MPGHLTNRWHTLRRTYLRSAKSDHITFHPWSNFSADASLPKAHALRLYANNGGKPRSQTELRTVFVAAVCGRSAHGWSRSADAGVRAWIVPLRCPGTLAPLSERAKLTSRRYD